MANYIMENGGCDLLKFGYNMVEENGRLLKVISLSKCIQLYSNILSKKEEIEQFYEYILFHKGILGNSISVSLWTSVFSNDIICDNNILFDTNISKAEDWLFCSDYLRYIKKILLWNVCPYNYRINVNSTINTFYLETDIGVEKGNYIYKKTIGKYFDFGILE